MVKFQKQLEGQLVPEWREAYMNYKQLKMDVRKIRQHLAKEQQICKQVLTDTVSHKTTFNIHATRSSYPQDGKYLIVHLKEQLDSCSSMEAIYETKLLEMVPWQEHDKVFFLRLDTQLNMVNKFYKSKERELVLRGKQLEVQMETLIDIRRALATCKIDDQSSSEDEFDKDIDIEFGQGECKIKKLWKKEIVCVNKSKVGHAQKMLRTAFIEYYKSLTLLRNYSSLNTLAFAKILKKYDKVTGKHVMDTYLRAVESAYFSSSDKVVNLVEKVENLFTKHFANNNRREALGCLRPSPQRNSNNKFFALGLFTGCSWSLLLVLVLMLTQSHILNYLRSVIFTRSIFPVFSTLVLLLFHIYIYGANVHFWRRTRINYAFIFEFAPGTELRGLEVMLFATALTTILMSCMLANLLLTTKGPILSRDGEIIPITVFLAFIGFVVLPFNICYGSTRFFFLRCVWRIMCSPFYKVEFADFFLADQFTSQITALRNLEYISCYYVSRLYRDLDSSICAHNHFIQNFQHVVAVLPYWWRLMQCMRRWLDDHNDRSQLANGGKYLSALIAVLIRLTYETNRTRVCLALYIVSSAIATVYQFYWDIVMDWGLLQRKSAHPWLRDQLMLKSKTPYFVSMAANGLLRLAWLYSLIHEVLRFGSIDHKYVDFISGMAEIARRGLWNFYRLENEHLNNVGKFRAVKTVPLPFKDMDQDS